MRFPRPAANPAAQLMQLRQPEALGMLDHHDGGVRDVDADLVVVCPGDLYGSVLPNFLTKGMREAVADSRGKFAYVCNLVTKQGNYGYKASDFVREIGRYAGRKPDIVIVNTKRPTRRVVDKYRKEASYFVEPDFARLRPLAGRSVGGELLVEVDSGDRRIVRHDSEKTARLVVGLL